MTIAPAYQLRRNAFGKLEFMQAEHGEGIGELAGAILDALGLKPVRAPKKGEADEQAVSGEEIEAEAAAHVVRVAIVGRPNAGKSTLVNALLGEERMITGPEPGLTRDAIATDFDWGELKNLINDTLGRPEEFDLPLDAILNDNGVVWPV